MIEFIEWNDNSNRGIGRHIFKLIDLFIDDWFYIVIWYNIIFSDHDSKILFNKIYYYFLCNFSAPTAVEADGGLP